MVERIDIMNMNKEQKKEWLENFSKEWIQTCKTLNKPVKLSTHATTSSGRNLTFEQFQTHDLVINGFKIGDTVINYKDKECMQEKITCFRIYKNNIYVYNGFILIGKITDIIKVRG